MRARTVAIVVVLSIAAVATSPAAGKPAARGTICGQVKGPSASFWSVVTGLKLKGTTWTVLATDVPCSTAMKDSPGLLGQWTKAKIGGSLTLAGFHCLKMTDRAYSGNGVASGGFVCGTSGTPAVFGSHTFSARMTDGWSTAQIRQYLGLN
jgi:hypothetical protein